VAITGPHIPFDENAPITKVVVNERNVMNYYKFVQGGPVEAGHLNVDGVELAVYVNSRYGVFEPDMMNKRATILFAIAGVGCSAGPYVATLWPSDPRETATTRSPSIRRSASSCSNSNGRR